MLHFLASRASEDPRKQLNLRLARPSCPTQRRSRFESARSELSRLLESRGNPADMSGLDGLSVAEALNVCGGQKTAELARLQVDRTNKVAAAEAALDFMSDKAAPALSQADEEASRLATRLASGVGVEKQTRMERMQRVSGYLATVSRCLNLTDRLRDVAVRKAVPTEEEEAAFVELWQLLESVQPTTNARKVLGERFAFIKTQLVKVLATTLTLELERSGSWPGAAEQLGDNLSAAAIRCLRCLFRIDETAAVATLARPLVEHFATLFSTAPLNRLDRPEWPIKHMKEVVFPKAVDILARGGVAETEPVVENLGLALVDGLRLFFRPRLLELSPEQVSGYLSVFLAEFDAQADGAFFDDFNSNWSGVTTKLAQGDLSLLLPRLSGQDLLKTVQLFVLADPRIQVAGPLLAQLAYTPLYFDPTRGLEKKLRDVWNALPSLESAQQPASKINEVHAAVAILKNTRNFHTMADSLLQLHRKMLLRVADFLLSDDLDEYSRQAVKAEYLARLNVDSRQVLEDLLSAGPIE